MDIKWKVWLQEEETKVFGRGPICLLKGIERLGSINKAAAEMGMAYSKATRLITNIETHLHIRVLERRVGGARGGGSTLTPEARDLIARFEKMEKEISEYIETRYKAYF